MPWCTPELAWTTPVLELEAALRGKSDFLRKTNPWRSKEDIEAERVAEAGPDPESMVTFFHALRAHAKPLPKRKREKGDAA